MFGYDKVKKKNVAFIITTITCIHILFKALFKAVHSTNNLHAIKTYFGLHVNSLRFKY